MTGVNMKIALKSLLSGLMALILAIQPVMAAELNNSSTGKWSETDASNTSPSPDGWPGGTYFNQVEPIGRSTMGAIKRFWDRINCTQTSTGSANAYVYTPTNSSYPTALVSGETYCFIASFANTGAATINVNSLGAKNIYYPGASGLTALTGGEIEIGQPVLIIYDGTQFDMISAAANGGPSIQAALALYAKLASPTFTGTPSLPTGTTGVTQSLNTSNTTLATTAFSNPGSLISGSGYFELPSGIIFQWGTSSANGSGQISVTFPLTFPNSVYSATITPWSNATSRAAVISSINTGGFSGNQYNTNTTAGVSGTVGWMAIGN